MDTIARAVSDPRRREILMLVRDEELTAGAIASHFDVTRPAISQHLKVLRDAGLVSERRDGTRRLYRARPEGLEALPSESRRVDTDTSVTRTSFQMKILIVSEPGPAEKVLSLLGEQKDLELSVSSGDPLEDARQMRPTTVVLDMALVARDPLDLLDAFARDNELKKVPILILGSPDDAWQRQSAFAAGASDFVGKYPPEAELATRLRYHCRGHLARMQRDEAVRALRDTQRQLIESHQSIDAMRRDKERTALGAGWMDEIGPPLQGLAELSQAPAARAAAQTLLACFHEPAARCEVDFSVRDVLQQALDWLKAPAAERGLQLEGSVDAGVPASLKADPGAFHQLLAGLLVPALGVAAAPSIDARVTVIDRDADRLWLSLEVRFVCLDEELPDMEELTFLNMARELARSGGGDLSLRVSPGQRSTLRATTSMRP